MLSYAEFSKLPASEKVVLCVARARTQHKIFTSVGSGVYFKTVPHFVDAITVNGVSLTKVTTTPAAGQYKFDPKTQRVDVNLADGSDPKTKTVIFTYKFFFSSAPWILPHDFANGDQVEFDARIESIGSLGQQLDDENTGIVLESNSNIHLQNNDGYFDAIFDTLVWENQTIEFYSWSPKIPIASAVKLFSGVIVSKAFDANKISFEVKDFVYKLRNKVNLSTFSTADGNIAPSMLGKPKRRIYGKVKQAQAVGIDNILDGYEITGLITVSQGSTAVTGSGTAFLDELSPEDELFITLDDGTIEKVGIESITSDGALVLGDEADFSVTNAHALCKPRIPWRKKNRRWHLAGHVLIQPLTTIVNPITSRRFLVDSTVDFYAGDTVEINGNFVQILRISGNYIITNQAIDPMPDIGNGIQKQPIDNVYFKDTELFTDRDFTLTNFPEAIIELDELAEFNVANARSVGVNLAFTNGSRTITTSATVDLRTLLKPRDWIRKNHISEPTWYEILDVREQTITLRTNFTGSTQTTGAKMKNINPIGDDALITVNTIGKRGLATSGPYAYKWLKTASDVVRDLVMNDSGFTTVDEVAFAQADADCPYFISMVIPENVGDEAPEVREVITKINESVFGSLYGNQSMNIAYSILNAKKPTDLTVVRDDDIISWSSSTEQKIINKVKVNYRPFVDFYSGSSATETYEYTSDFVDKFVGINNTEERTIYLYEADKAQIIAQRIAFFKTLSNCKITLKGKLNLALTTVNDKMYLEFDRLFKRYGGYDTKKIGIVTGVRKNGFDVEVELTDLGNIFNRIPVIAPSGAQAYSAATRDDAVKYGYILDNNTLTPDNTSEIDLGNNRIG